MSRTRRMRSARSRTKRRSTSSIRVRARSRFGGVWASSLMAGRARERATKPTPPRAGRPRIPGRGSRFPPARRLSRPGCASRAADPGAGPPAGPGGRARPPPGAPRHPGRGARPRCGAPAPPARPRGPGPQGLPQVQALGRVEAQVPGAVGGQAAAVAGGTEGPGGRGDDAEDRAVGQPEAVGGGVVRRSTGSIGPSRSASRFRISLAETTSAADQRVAPPTSMYSMKRTSMPRCDGRRPGGHRSRRRSRRASRRRVQLRVPRKPAAEGRVDARRSSARQLVAPRELGGSGPAAACPG